jgi:hypothetical protein
MRAQQSGNLDGGGADAAAHCVDQDPLAPRQACPGDQRVIGREECLGDRRGLSELELNRHRKDFVLVRHDIFRVSSAADQPHHPVADVPAAGIGPQCLDLAGIFQPRNIGRRSRRSRIMATPLIDIGAVEPRGLDPHPHLVEPGLRGRDIPQLDDFVTTGAGVDDSSHN